MAGCSTDTVHPASPAELAEAMGSASARHQTICSGGHFSKRRMGGALGAAQTTISTAAMKRVRQYEPRDLTISVEAGISYCELSRVLAERRQMVPLDPPFSSTATIGGILATNGSGPRRRLYGTARDLVIGMEFATLEGKLIQSGGMVVKNVAGLDMAKLLIGSFGTLAAITVVNLKLIPQPPFSRTFVLSCNTLDAAVAARDAILHSALDPEAIDLINPAAMESPEPAFRLAVRAGGNAAAIARYERELPSLGARPLPGGEAVFWSWIQNFTPRYLDAHADGAVVRVSCTLKELKTVILEAPGPAIARAGSGVCYLYFEQFSQATAFAAEAAREHPQTVVECAPESRGAQADLWPVPGRDLEIMKRIKRMLDPDNLLNPGRLYGRI